MLQKDNVNWMVMSEGNDPLAFYRNVEPSFINLL